MGNFDVQNRINSEIQFGSSISTLCFTLMKPDLIHKFWLDFCATHDALSQFFSRNINKDNKMKDEIGWTYRTHGRGGGRELNFIWKFWRDVATCGYSLGDDVKGMLKVQGVKLWTELLWLMVC
jgi:hypothetical protein